MASTSQQRDLERGHDFETEKVSSPWSPVQTQDEENMGAGRGMNDRRADGSSTPYRDPYEPDDFGDSANPLWTLYEKEAKNRDKDQIQTLKDDMDRVLLFAGFFSAVLSLFVVPKIQDLGVNPAQQSVYYQNQSVQILAQISQQIASIGTQIPLNVSQPPTYPTFHPSASDCRVNIYWLMSLICSLSAALLTTLVQQWVRSYMRIFQRSRNPLKTARMRQFLFEGVERLPVVAEVILGFIHISLFLFFLGLGDAILNINTIIGAFIIVPISLCGSIYLYTVIAPFTHPQSPYRSPFSGFMWYIVRKLRHVPFRRRPRAKMIEPEEMELRQEKLAMKPTKGRKARDERAVRWLVDNIKGSNEMEDFVLAIPGSFDREWGRAVWRAVSAEGDSRLDVRGTWLTPTPDDHDHPRLEGTTVYDLCGFVRYSFSAYNNQEDSMSKDARRSRIHGCIETTASLVCCTDVPLGWFGEVGEVLSEVGRTEGINELSTIRSNPSFTVRWTCLSLVAIRQMVMVKGNVVRALAGFAVDGIARFQPDYGVPDALASNGARRIDENLREAWQHVEALYRVFEPWDQKRTGEEILNILEGCEPQISELERIEIEADSIDDVDWRISLLQDAIDRDTNNLMRRLPGVLPNQFKSSKPNLTAEAFDFPIFGNTPITPQFILPRQQLQGLASLGRGLRDVIENRNPEKHGETVESLESLHNIPISIRRLRNVMIRQLWRLQDLRDGGGFGFIIELFFLSLRQLSSAPSSPELKQVFYTGTFKAITSGWENFTDSSGTQGILLDLICDLVIKGRGSFSDFAYPEYIVELLLELVGKMVDRHGNADPQIHKTVRELLSVDSRNAHSHLRDKALLALGSFYLPMS